MSAFVSSRFTFPNPVNEIAARLVAAGVLVMALAVAVLGQTWILVPLAYGFVARVAAGPRYSPLGLFVTRVAVPRLGIAPRNVPGPAEAVRAGDGRRHLRRGRRGRVRLRRAGHRAGPARR